MLESMYHDLVEPARLQLGSFAMKDLSLDELETAFTNSKKSINESFNIEFFLSTFLHHLRIDGTHIQVELNRKTSKTQIIRYINNNQREFGSLRLENYDYRVLF